MKRVRIHFCRAFYFMCGIAITLMLGTGVRVGAQTASAELSFEVATIKPVVMDASHPFDPMHCWAHLTADHASYWSMTLKSLIIYAFDVKAFQVSGPESIDKDRHDIEAKLPEGTTEGDDKKMMQTLLKDRFQLKFHIEKRELEADALVVGKHGANLKPSLTDPPEAGTAAPSRGPKTIKFDRENSAIHYEFSKMTMEELAMRLGGCLGRDQKKVDDETGIKGDYQIAFDCPMRSSKPAMDGIASDPEGSPLSSSSPLVESLDALGLKLEKRKVPMDVYVIDHSEKPSAN
jgi:uncharacterized protein (TIGR03435 family)